MEQTITLTLTVREEDLLIKGLSKLPLEESLSLQKLKKKLKNNLILNQTLSFEEKKD